MVKAYALAVAMLPRMLEDDRRRSGWSVGQAAWRLGISVREYRELEAGARSPSFETWDRICKLVGWAQTFVGTRRGNDDLSMANPARVRRRARPGPAGICVSVSRGVDRWKAPQGLPASGCLVLSRPRERGGGNDGPN